MDGNLPIKPQGGPAQSGVIRPDAAPIDRQTVRTELSSSQSVSANNASEAQRPLRENRNEPSQQNTKNANPQGERDREVIFDNESQEVIFRVVDVSSGQVVRQIPEEALLKLRAYRKDLESTTNQPQVNSPSIVPEQSTNNVEKTA